MLNNFTGKLLKICNNSALNVFSSDIKVALFSI